MPDLSELLNTREWAVAISSSVDDCPRGATADGRPRTEHHDPSCAITRATNVSPSRGSLWVFQSFTMSAVWTAEFRTAMQCAAVVDSEVRMQWSSHPALVLRPSSHRKGQEATRPEHGRESVLEYIWISDDDDVSLMDVDDGSGVEYVGDRPPSKRGVAALCPDGVRAGARV